MTALVLMGLVACPGASDVAKWTFETDTDVRAWVANGHLAKVTVKDGVVSADAVDWDPFFTCKGIEFAATPWQFILLRIKADKPGSGQIFWSGETTGKYGGFSPAKTTSFQLKGDRTWEEVAVFPSWQAEGTIRQLRLDVYDGAHFDIDAIRVLTWGQDKPPQTDVFAWELKGDVRAWRVHPSSDVLLAPRLRLNVEDKGWVTVRLKCDKESSANILWSAADVRGLKSQAFTLRGDGKLRHYNVELAGIRDWHDPVVAFGIRLPTDANVHLESIRMGAEPSGPPEATVRYFGFENGVNRAGRPSHVIATFGNRGGSGVAGLKVRLAMPEGLACVGSPAEQVLDRLAYDDTKTFAWRVVAKKPGEYPVRLVSEGLGAPEPVSATLRFEPPVNLPQASYVPEPRPVQTDLDVCIYYFPGWPSDAKWDCIRRVAPIRKPLLGYYDEANPACVDWQIKWAVENGIKCFLVDWYWVKGNKHLEHWFEAYRKARYRDHLKVAIMWANHNPPDTHSVADWHNVTREWIDRYFTLNTYYHIDGKPAVFIWSPNNVRRDLKGSDVVAKAMAESQKMARAAGHKGITFLAMFGHESASGVKALLSEGYYGATNYHEWADAPALAKDRKRTQFQDIVETVRKTWESKVARCGKLVYHPAVDTGWDSRPWHGDRSRIINGRTPARFENLLRQAKEYCTKIGRTIVVLGPANEWGEGSYIEPNTEFGFEMMEAVRKVFAKGDPASWPVNVAPADVGLGPYDFPTPPQTNTWSFDNSNQGWRRMMGVSNLTARDGALRFKTLTSDPAIVVSTGGFRAKAFTRAVVRMQVIGDIGQGDHGQIFFSVGGRAMTETTSLHFPLATDGKMHTYAIDLTTIPRWRNRITILRFDPCSARDVEVVVDEIRFEKGPAPAGGTS